MRYFLSALWVNGPAIAGVGLFAAWLRTSTPQGGVWSFADLGAALLAGYLLGHDTRSNEVDARERKLAKRAGEHRSRHMAAFGCPKGEGKCG